MFCISEKSLERFSLLMQAEALDEAAEIIPHHRALTRMAKQKRKEAE